MIQFSARGLAPFWEIICFVAETLYQKVWQVLNFHLTLQNEISLGIAATTALLTSTMNADIVVIVQRMFTALDSFPFMAVPFFILSGNLMEKGGISKRLIRFARVLLGRLPSSLAVITTMSSAFFGAISGSNPATVAAIGGLWFPT
jgi:C4-dicarboxylate transporter DctM subunit